MPAPSPKTLCRGGVSVKRTAVSVLGEGSAILIQKSAPLRDADIYAARQSHVAFVIEQGVVSAINREQGWWNRQY